MHDANSSTGLCHSNQLIGVVLQMAHKMPQMKLLYMMGNVTCVMKEMKMLKDDNEVDVDSIKARIMAMSLPEEQVDDLKQGVDKCIEFSSCLPVHGGPKSPMMATIGRQMAFFKCFKVRRRDLVMLIDSWLISRL